MSSGTNTPIHAQRFQELAAPLHGLMVSETWRGMGSAIFLELGEMHPEARQGRDWVRWKGQFTVMVQWSWRVERVRSIAFGSWSDDPVITRKLPQLKGRTVESVQVFARLPELQIALSDGWWLSTYMTTDAQPSWAILLPGESIHVLRGCLQHHRE